MRVPGWFLQLSRLPTNGRIKTPTLRCLICPIAKIVQGASVDARDERRVLNSSRLQTSAAGNRLRCMAQPKAGSIAMSSGLFKPRKAIAE